MRDFDQLHDAEALESKTTPTKGKKADKPVKKVADMPVHVEAEPASTHKDLKLNIPKDIKYMSQLPPQQQQQPRQDAKPAKKHREERRDVIPKADLVNPSAFDARKDPFSIDFEKIALRRAAKQSEFQRKYEDEYRPWDADHGGRYVYRGEH